MSQRRPVVVVATPLPREQVARLEALEPRVRVHTGAGLVPAQRFPGDRVGGPEAAGWSADPRVRRMLAEADVLLGVPEESPAVLAQLLRDHPRIRWVHAMTAGAGAVVRDARLDDATMRRVLFTSSAGSHAIPLAEFALFGLLAGAKRLPALLADQRDRRWPERRAVTGQLAEQRVVVVGLGGIGRRTAEILRALGTRVVGVHRRPVDSDLVAELYPPDELHRALTGAHGVVMALPHTPSTERMLDASALACLAPGATVVNVGRGATLDEAALIEALRSGQVGFAALDVFEVEPLPPDNPLWGMPNVLVSPHTSALSLEEDGRIVTAFLANLERFLAGEPLRNRVDTVEFY